MPAGSDLTEALKANPVAKLLTQIEQNTRSEKTAVLYKTRQNLGANKVSIIQCMVTGRVWQVSIHTCQVASPTHYPLVRPDPWYKCVNQVINSTALSMVLCLIWKHALFTGQYSSVQTKNTNYYRIRPQLTPFYQWKEENNKTWPMHDKFLPCVWWLVTQPISSTVLKAMGFKIFG